MQLIQSENKRNQQRDHINYDKNKDKEIEDKCFSPYEYKAQDIQYKIEDVNR